MTAIEWIGIGLGAHLYFIAVIGWVLRSYFALKLQFVRAVGNLPQAFEGE